MVNSSAVASHVGKGKDASVNAAKRPDTLRLLVGIPCLNEAATVGEVIDRIPRRISGILTVDILVVDDGSTDETSSVAREHGAMVLRHPQRRGLGRAFDSLTQFALTEGYDLFVNIDGDNQFNPEDIRRLVGPIVDGEAEFVTASRFVDSSKSRAGMPSIKWAGNHMMSYLVSRLSGKRFYDVSCGYRAFSKEALMHLNLHGAFTHTQETFLNMSESGLAMAEVPIDVKYFKDRKSRVAGNLLKYGARTLTILGRAYRDYNPLRFFWTGAAIFALIGALFGLRLLLHFLETGKFMGEIWAGFVGAGFVVVSLALTLMGVVADMGTRIRKNQERMLFLLRKQFSLMQSSRR